MKSSGYSSRLPLSISARLTLWYGLAMLLLLSLFAIFTYTSFRISVEHDFDRHLEHEKRQLMPYLQLGGQGPRFVAIHEVHSVAHHTDGIYGTYVRLLSTTGEVLYNSPNFANHDRLEVLLPEHPEPARLSRQWENQPFRTHYTPLLTPRGSLTGWIEVSGFEWPMQQRLLSINQSLIFGIAISVLFAIAGGYLLARGALKPISQFTTAANRIQASDLSARLHSNTRVHDEMSVLVETFNGMMDRLEASFNRERRFTSNAAHELLTPLTTVKNEIEITRRRQRDGTQYEETLDQILTDVNEMTTMVQGLLQLSRMERLSQEQREPVDLVQVVHDHVRDQISRAGDKHVHIELTRLDPAVVLGQPVAFGQIVDNLLDNAIKYTPSGGTVRVSLRSDAGDVVLSVADSGVGFTEEQAGKLFDRFYRGDTPEVQAEQGSGLGLAIVATLVQGYGGDIRAFSNGPGTGSRFDVGFPRFIPA